MVDVKSAIALLELGPMPPQPDAESQIEYLAWFRFPITWTYIGGPEPEVQSPKAALAPLSLTLAPGAPLLPSRNPVAFDASGPEDGLLPTGSSARWEMMVPKMAYPPARSVVNLSAAASPALAAPAPQEACSPAPAISQAPLVSAKTSGASVSGQFALPFLLRTPEDQFLARYGRQIVFAAIAIVAVCCLAWGLASPSSSARNATSSPVNATSWSHQSVSPPGRSLTLYEPSRFESDYRMEFSWVPDSAGVGWVFRTRDENNYYAARLSLQQRAASGVLVAEHFSVFAGAESPHSRKVIPLPNNAGLLRVHMDALGPAFKLFLENDPADSWTDARLNSGAVGFYDDGARLPKLLALSFTFINNSVSRTTVVSLP